MSQIARIINRPLNPSHLLQLGPSLLNNIGKNMQNKFRQQGLFSAEKIANGAIFTFLEKIGIASFWHNPLIKRNNKFIVPTHFCSFLFFFTLVL